jgi:hypothetical protein
MLAMLLSNRPVLGAIAFGSILGTAVAISSCSSDTPPVDNHDASSADVSRDGEGAMDAVTPDATIDDSGMDAVSLDAVSPDATRIDGSSDAASTDG